MKIPEMVRRKIKNELTSYGKQKFFTVTDIQNLFGWKSEKPVKRLMQNAEKVLVNGKNMYFINDLIDALELAG